MPKTKKHGPQIKDDKLYEKVREQGASKEKAARIANAANKTSRSAIGKKGGKHPKYEDWKVEDLKKKASKIGIEGRSKMNKNRLIDAIRHH